MNNLVWIENICILVPESVSTEVSSLISNTNELFDKLLQIIDLNNWNLDDLKNFLRLSPSLKNLQWVRQVITLPNSIKLENLETKKLMNNLKMTSLLSVDYLTVLFDVETLLKLTKGLDELSVTNLLFLINSIFEKQIWTVKNFKNLIKKVSDLAEANKDLNSLNLINILSGLPVSNENLTQEQIVQSIPSPGIGLIGNVLNILGLDEILKSLLENTLDLNQHLQKLACLFNQKSINVTNSIFQGRCNQNFPCNVNLNLDCIEGFCIAVEVL